MADFLLLIESLRISHFIGTQKNLAIITNVNNFLQLHDYLNVFEHPSYFTKRGLGKKVSMITGITMKQNKMMRHALKKDI